MTWIPRDYIRLREWLTEEVKRRGVDDTNANWSRAFDDLAEYLANEDDPEETRSALFIFESGREPHPMPLYEWRKAPDKRAELTHHRVYRNYNVMGFGSGEFGCVAIRKRLRLTDIIDIEPDQPAPPLQQLIVTPPSDARGNLSAADLDSFLSDLNHQYGGGQKKPTIRDIDRLGREKFGQKWRKGYRERRNEMDANGNPKYPNLYCTTPGRQVKVRVKA